MARPKKQKVEDQQQQQEANPETEERKRLKNLAYCNNIISHSSAKEFTPLTPSKTVIKHHGKDILKKSQRKNRYLFSFSGLLAPIAGGKIGDLTDLGSKNPILYLDFPQGRMKLSGTIVYPKNRYLTLQFPRGGKNVMCEDWFDTMIVFSDAFWVGKKEENPDEARLEFPKELYEGAHPEVDFKGGAGATATKRNILKNLVTMSTEEEPLSGSPVDEMEAESPERHQNLIDLENSTPVRQSGRTAGKRFNFAEVSSGDDSAENGSDISGEVNEDTAKNFKSCSDDQDPNIPDRSVERHNSEDIVQPPQSSLPTSGINVSSRTSLVQSTISTLFKKAESKNSSESLKKIASCKVSSEKMQLNRSKSKEKIVVAEKKKVKTVTQDKKSGAKNDGKKRKAVLPEVEDDDEDEDDIEESSSASEEIDESDESDDSWQA